jgi:hypothetical protein
MNEMRSRIKRNEDYIASLPGTGTKRNWYYRLRQALYKLQLKIRFFLFQKARRYYGN